MAGLDKSKLVTADILGQATAMGVHLNSEDAETRDRLMREVISEQGEPTLESPIDIEDIPPEDLEPEDRVIQSAKQESKDKFLEPELPEDLNEELTAPDFDQQAEDEINEQRYTQPEPEETRFEDVSYEMVSPEDTWDEMDSEVLEERKKRIAAEKKAAYFENLRIKSDQRRWADEARKYFPLAGSALDAGNINARSRKEFLRKAKRAHETVLPYIKEAIDQRDKTLDADRRKVREETREEMVKAWGRATTGPSGYPTRADDFQEELDSSRKKNDLARSIGILRRRAEAAGQGGDLE